MLLWTLEHKYCIELVFVWVLEGYISRNGIAGSYDSCIFSFLRNHYTVFHNGYINLHSYQEYRRLPLSLYPHQHVLFVFILFIAILIGVVDISLWLWFTVRWWFPILSTFSCAYWPSAFPLGKNVFSPSFHFLIKFFMLTYMTCLYMLDINPSLVMPFADIYPISRLSFHLSLVSFAVQKFLSLIKSHFMYLYFDLL